MTASKNPYSPKVSTTSRPAAAARAGHVAQKLATIENRVQGEGDYQAAREFNKLERKFVASHPLPRAAPKKK